MFYVSIELNPEELERLEKLEAKVTVLEKDERDRVKIRLMKGRVEAKAD